MTWILSTVEFNRCKIPLIMVCMEGVLVAPIESYPLTQVLWMHTTTPPSHKYILALFPGSSPCARRRKMHAATPPLHKYTRIQDLRKGANIYCSLPEAVHRGTYRADKFFRLHFSVIRMGSRSTFMLCTASSRCTMIAGPRAMMTASNFAHERNTYVHGGVY